MRLLRAATLITPDPDVTARRYQSWFDYVPREAGEISPARAAAWGAPAMAGRRYAVLAPASGAPVFLRFVEGQAPPAFVPLRSYGWAAIEICVQDVHAVHARLRDAPFTVIGPPKPLDGVPKIRPMQVQGPDGEVIFLTQIDGDEPDEILPRAAAPIDSLFIAVLACSDIAATRAWFAAQLGLAGRPDFELAYGTLSRAFGLPAATRHRISVLTHDNDAFLQLDQYPPAATARPVNLGELPPGIAMASFLVPGAGGTAKHDGIVYGGGGAAARRAPDGSLVELIFI